MKNEQPNTPPPFKKTAVANQLTRLEGGSEKVVAHVTVRFLVLNFVKPDIVSIKHRTGSNEGVRGGNASKQHKAAPKGCLNVCVCVAPR